MIKELVKREEEFSLDLKRILKGKTREMAAINLTNSSENMDKNNSYSNEEKEIFTTNVLEKYFSGLALDEAITIETIKMQQ